MKDEIIQKLESLLKLVSDTDILDTADVEEYYRNEDRIINWSRIDDSWDVLQYKWKLKELLK